MDWKGIYSGDEYAMKAAGHEMRSLIAFYNYGQPIGLRVPLMALVNYLGFRLVALSILPVSRHTLVYGSADGGQTVHKSHDRVAHLMKVRRTGGTWQCADRSISAARGQASQPQEAHRGRGRGARAVAALSVRH